MKRILFLGFAIILSITSLYAEKGNVFKQTQSVVKLNDAKHAYVKAINTLPVKIEFIDFYIKTSNIATTAKRKLLLQMLFNGMKTGAVITYSAQVKYDSLGRNIFSKPLAYRTPITQLKDTIVSVRLDESGQKKIVNLFAVDKINGYRIKRVVYTGNKVNIVGIAPVRPIVATNGDTVGSHIVCWFKYNQCKKVLANNPELANIATQQMLFAGGKIKE